MGRRPKQEKIEKAERLNNSRSLDVHRISGHPEVKAVIQQLFDEMNADGLVNARNTDKLRKHLKAFVLDLYHAHCFDPTMYIGYSRNKNSYAPGTRLHQLFLSHSMVVIVVNFLIAHEYVENVSGYQRKDGQGKQSRIRANQKLIDLIQSKGVVPNMVESEPDETKLVILRGPKEKDQDQGPEIDYEDTPETLQMKENLKLINANNHKHSILLYLPDDELRQLSKRMNADPDRGSLDLNRTSLHRVFNNGSWKQGGRFFGGWWQGVPREFREFIRINDKDVVECDYSGMHVNMLYAWESLPMPDGDVYHINGYSNDKEIFRPFVKALLLIMVNAGSREEARAAIQQKVNKKKLILPTEIKSTAGKHLFPLLDAFELKHQPIKNYFCTGKGIDLQYYDSVIAEKVMLHFAKIGYAILPLHDSFIIHHGLEDELLSAMNQAFKEQFNVNAKIDIKYRSISRRQEREQGNDNGNLDLEQLLKLKQPYSIYFRYLEDNRP